MAKTSHPDLDRPIYRVRGDAVAHNPCPMCGEANDATRLDCHACGETLDLPARPLEPSVDKTGSGFALGAFGVLYHPILMVLTVFLAELWLTILPLSLLLGLVMFFLIPILRVLVVACGERYRTQYHLGARMVHCLGMLWLPLWIGWLLCCYGLPTC